VIVHVIVIVDVIVPVIVAVHVHGNDTVAVIVDPPVTDRGQCCSMALEGEGECAEIERNASPGPSVATSVIARGLGGDRVRSWALERRRFGAGVRSTTTAGVVDHDHGVVPVRVHGHDHGIDHVNVNVNVNVNDHAVAHGPLVA
jgi:hypothetical protein